MPEMKALISMRVSHHGYVVPGSLQGKCSECGELVWIAPSSWLFIHDNPGMKILCNECGLKQMMDEPGEIEMPTPAQLDEIKEYLKERHG